MTFLSKSLILSHLQRSQHLKIKNIVIAKSIHSTSTHLLELLQKNPLKSNEIVVCLAEEQTGGRGRQGKVWLSDQGQVYASIALLMPDNTQLSLLSLMMGALVLKCFRHYGLDKEFRLKWPNDVYYQGRKCCGILIETSPASTGKRHVVVGLGINCAPLSNPLLAGTATDLATIMGQPIDRNRLIGELIAVMLDHWLTLDVATINTLLSEWQQADMLLNRYIVIKQHSCEVSGIALGITPLGELIIRDYKGETRTLSYGDVSVRLDDRSDQSR